MTTIQFHAVGGGTGATTQSDSNSSPFYDYNANDDVLYVGDDAGVLHKFTGVFLTTPAEVTTSPWPAAVNSGGTKTACCSTTNTSNQLVVGSSNAAFFASYIGAAISGTGIPSSTTIASCCTGSGPSESLTMSKNATATGTTTVTVVSTAAPLASPVYDSVSGNIFVGDNTGRAILVTSSGTVGDTSKFGGGTTIDDAPLVDSSLSTGRVFWFQTVNNLPATNRIAQTTTTSLTSPAPVTVTLAASGSTTRTSVMHAGAFDSTYITSSDGTGYLYVCAPSISSTNHPSLYSIGIHSGTMSGTTAFGPIDMVSSSGNQECSPITEFFNSGTDRLFVGVTANGNLTGCSSATGCIYSFVPPTYTTVPAGSGCCTTVNGSAQLTVGTNSTFSSSLSGEFISGVNVTNIPSGTTISSCCTGMGNTRSLTMSQPAAGTNATAFAVTVAPSISAAAGLASTSGIIIDNASSNATTGGSQVYFRH
jgi:hypothetical protein